MATTLGDLIEEVSGHLHAYTSDQENATTLAADITSADTSLSFTEGDVVSRGLVEIGTELIQVTSVDTTAATGTVPAWGRAQQGTTPAPHLAGVKVTVAPRFPRGRIAQVINEVIRGLYPDLFGVTVDTSLTTSASAITYQLPAAADAILDLRYQTIGPSLEWVPIRRFRLDSKAATGSFASGVSLDIFQDVYPGRTIKVTYRTALAELGSVESTPFTTSGLGEPARDIVVLYAAARLLGAVEAGHTADTSVAQADFSVRATPGAATLAGRALLAQAEMRKATERLRLLNQYPAFTYHTR